MYNTKVSSFGEHNQVWWLCPQQSKQEGRKGHTVPILILHYYKKLIMPGDNIEDCKVWDVEEFFTQVMLFLQMLYFRGTVSHFFKMHLTTVQLPSKYQYPTLLW